MSDSANGLRLDATLIPCLQLSPAHSGLRMPPKLFFSSPTLLPFLLTNVSGILPLQKMRSKLLFAVVSQGFHHLCSPFLSGLNSTTALPGPLMFTPCLKQVVPFLPSRLPPAVLSAQVLPPFSPACELPLSSSQVQGPNPASRSPGLSHLLRDHHAHLSKALTTWHYNYLCTHISPNNPLSSPRQGFCLLYLCVPSAQTAPHTESFTWQALGKYLMGG